MKYKYRVFLHGLFASVVNGMSASAAVMIVDIEDFNPLDGGLRKLGAVLLTSGIISFFTYLKNHPLPSLEKDTDYYEVRSQQISQIKGTGDGK